MKKILFFLLTVILFIIVIINNSYEVTNKTIINDKVNINYPYFNTYHINNNILNYINKCINENNDSLVIDYDYKDNILTFYKRVINNNMLNEKVISFKISKYTFEKIETNNKTLVNKNITDIYNIDKNTKFIALTFDDGPNYNTSKVIDTLNKYNVKATFFVMGKNIKGHELTLKKMLDSNMEIGNHTFNHLLLTKYKKDTILNEIDNTTNLIYEVTNTYPKLLRPSYGSVNKKIKGLANYPIIIWDIDTLDWKYKNSKRIANTVLSKVKDGDIVLMHDIYKSTLNALDLVIPELLNNNYKLVTVSELFYYKNITLENGKVYGYARN